MIHAVMGANGAGKSTLMKVLAGSNPDYTGDVLYNGNVVELRNPAAAKKLGIQIVYQEVDMALIPTLSVAENVMFNDMVMNMGHKQFVNYGKIRKDAKEALARVNIDIDVKRWCGTLTLAQKQMVLLARAVQNSCNFPDTGLSDSTIIRYGNRGTVPCCKTFKRNRKYCYYLYYTSYPGSPQNL